MQRIEALDGLRAVAVIAVVGFHCVTPFTRGGHIGVSVFFVLSGYLITSLLLGEIRRSGRISVGRFYLNRFLRLAPPLFMMLAAYVLVRTFLAPGGYPLFDALLAMTYLTDYSVAIFSTPTIVRHTWSLSIEEHFYLLWPVVVLCLSRLRPINMARCLFGLFVVATAWRIVDTIIWGDWWLTYYRFDTRLSGLLLGSFLTALPWRPKPETAGVLIRWSTLLLVALVFSLRFRSVTSVAWGGVVVDLAAGALVLGLVSTRQSAIGRFLSSSLMVYLGALSYSIYLWHYPIAYFIRDEFKSGTVFVIVSGASIAISAISYRYLERPLKDVRRRISSIHREVIEGKVGI